MKAKLCISCILAAGLLALVGCSKSQPATPQMEINGIKLDVPKMQQAFATSKPELQASANKAVMSIRYGMYSDALAELSKLAGAADLTDDQKKVVSDVIEQVKQLVAKSPQRVAPQQAH